MHSTNTTVSPIPTSQVALIVGSIASILTLLGGAFLGFYNGVCKDQISFGQSQQQALVGEIKQLTLAIQENNQLIEESLKEKDNGNRI